MTINGKEYFKENDHLMLFECNKPKSKKAKSGQCYHTIAVDQKEGPYYDNDSNQYKLDVSYHSHNKLYSVNT